MTNISLIEIIYNIISGYKKVQKKIILLLTGGHDRRYSLNTSLIEKEIGWNPKTNYKDGIKKLTKTICKLVIVAGARPNFMKISPIIHEINKLKDGGVDIFFDLVHTGQHYDKNISSNFQELGIPYPTVNLECGSGYNLR